MYNMGVLFQELKAAIDLDAKNSNKSQLILTARVRYSPSVSSASYPIEMMQLKLGWIDGGLSTNKMVLCLPFYGFAWTLMDPIAMVQLNLCGELLDKRNNLDWV
ncbi:hypothetical protein Pint_14622 [Pistacia integerrima]|uniref:Uncharacterized protein n=1 Tax=Pistacia integerrima TaxID=434235 RepID=A0ACC0Y862_9ROSI|nr:hypothetical protein Pint_14622 [Pistacia integerrima]